MRCYTRQILTGLDYLHRHGIIHRHTTTLPPTHTRAHTHACRPAEGPAGRRPALGRHGPTQCREQCGRMQASQARPAWRPLPPHASPPCAPPRRLHVPAMHGWAGWGGGCGANGGLGGGLLLLTGAGRMPIAPIAYRGLARSWPAAKRRAAHGGMPLMVCGAGTSSAPTACLTPTASSRLPHTHTPTGPGPGRQESSCRVCWRVWYLGYLASWRGCHSLLLLVGVGGAGQRVSRRSRPACE